MESIMWNNITYPFLYETHVHTYQGSACARDTGYDMAKALHEDGYKGMIVTDHNWGGNTRIPNDIPWRDWVLRFEEGYLDAKRYGDANDFDVFFGYESGYNGTEFLIYGVDSTWLISNQEIKEASIELQYKMIKEAGGMVIHAHPYREEPYIPEIRLYPEYVDGVEGINATHSNKKSLSHNNPMFDEQAILYANNHKLPMTAGSDVHSVNVFGGGVAFKSPLTSINDYCERILTKNDYILTNGDDLFDKQGNKL